MKELFRPSGESHREAVTDSTASQALNNGSAVRVSNIGTAIAYIRFGNASVEATNVDMPMNVGGVEVFDRTGHTHMAYIGDANTTLIASTGEGV